MSSNSGGSNGYRKIKTTLHQKILEEIDLENLHRVDEETVRRETRRLIRSTLDREKTPLTSAERERISDEILDELFGLG